ncbi:N-acetylmuramoyl-L-alanine amidase [Flavobacterium frigoris]|uniref:N-acetylmuramoyl-L-alanine amidase n=1 Tax=Flavobacterium frigoris TaxID=229204 RepID=A0A1H9LNN7_FLAFI|nr:N-acetylmuramoyl-L-alanine amidase [Flavobacterium frigoris]SER12837.1 N-acetylmuramoyl-L-alanine amidase [Flavobacterium frigoris]
MIQLSPLVVFPIAGHHNADPGAVYNSIKEADKTKELRNLVSKYLTLKAHKHIMDNDAKTNRQLQSRIKPGSGSVLVDHHFNASLNPASTGVEVIVANTANANSKALAKELADGTARVLGIANRGVKTEKDTARGSIGILNLKAGIACLVEVCFLSNPNDMAKYELRKDELAKFYAQTYIKYDDLV